jgi:hypothetical protein
MKRFLVSGSANFGIEAETGVSNAELQGDSIAGTWLATPKVIHAGASRPIAVQLLNSLIGVELDRRPEVALKFTKRFGPLAIPYRAGSSFSFPMFDWVAHVARLTEIWAWVARASREKVPADISLFSGEFVRFADGGVTLRTHRLGTFVALEIASVPHSLLCVCANHRYKGALFEYHGCKSPYFIASDGREKYCSESCARAGKRRANLDWWNKNRKGGEDGTQKAR